MGSHFSTGTFANEVKVITQIEYNALKKYKIAHEKKSQISMLDLETIFNLERKDAMQIFSRLDLEGRGKISALDMWGGFCLACSGINSDKIAFLSTLAGGRDGYINEAEATLVMHSACRGLARLRLKGVKEPSMKEINCIVVDCFLCKDGKRRESEVNLEHIQSFCKKDTRVRNYLSNLDSSASVHLCYLYEEEQRLLKELAAIDAALDNYELIDGSKNRSSARIERRGGIVVKKNMSKNKAWRKHLVSVRDFFELMAEKIKLLEKNIFRIKRRNEEEETAPYGGIGIFQNCHELGTKIDNATTNTIAISATVGQLLQSKMKIKFDIATNLSKSSPGQPIKLFACDMIKNYNHHNNLQVAMWIDFYINQSIQSGNLLRKLVSSIKSLLSTIPQDLSQMFYTHHDVQILEACGKSEAICRSSHKKEKQNIDATRRVLRISLFNRKDPLGGILQFLPFSAKDDTKCSFHLDTNIDLGTLMGPEPISLQEGRVGFKDQLKDIAKSVFYGETNNDRISIYNINTLLRKLGLPAFNQKEFQNFKRYAELSSDIDGMISLKQFIEFLQKTSCDTELKKIGIGSLDNYFAAKISLSGTITKEKVNMIEAILDAAPGKHCVQKIITFAMKFCTISFTEWNASKLSDFFEKNTIPEWLKTPGYIERGLKKMIHFLSNGNEGFLHDLRKGVSSYLNCSWDQSYLEEWKDLTEEELDQEKDQDQNRKLELVIEEAKKYGIHNGKNTIGNTLDRWKQFLDENESLMKGFKEKFDSILKMDNALEGANMFGRRSDSVSSLPLGTVQKIEILSQKVVKLKKNMPPKPTVMERRILETHISELERLKDALEHAICDSIYNGLVSYDGMRVLLDEISCICFGNNGITLQVALEGLNIFKHLPVGIYTKERIDC